MATFAEKLLSVMNTLGISTTPGRVKSDAAKADALLAYGQALGENALILDDAGLTKGGLALTSGQAGVMRAGIGAGGLLKAGRASAIGDSVTAVGTGSWFHQLCLISGGQIRRAINAGVAGNTTTQMAARVVADIPKAAKSDLIFVSGGSNDTAITDALTVQNLVGMYKYAQGTGASACMVLMPPRSDSTGNRDKIITKRIAVNNYCTQHGLVLIDPWRGFIAEDGGWSSGASGDGVHPSAATARAAAADAWDQLSPMLQLTWDGLPAMGGVPGSLISTYPLLADTEMDGAPHAWAGYAMGGLVTTKTTLPGDIGNVWRMETAGVNGSAAAVAGERVEERTISGLTLAAGTRIAIAGRVSLAGYDSGIRCHVRCLPNGGSSALALEPTVFSGDLDGAIVWAETVVPAGGSTSVLIQYRLATTGTSAPSVGYVELSELEVWDLTARGDA